MRGQVYRDRWGIPYLRAKDHLSLAFLQGWVTAVDRAWQLEVERHRAQGTSAAFLGPAALDWDIFARRARLTDTARHCYDALDAETAGWVDSYVAGVNTALALGARRAPEFGRVGLAAGRWAPWTPLAVWLSHHILFAGFPAKLWRTRVARLLGPTAVDLFATDGTARGGSNGWLIAPERTASGAALLAGDPHRFIELPGIYQQIRLACPEYDAVGLAIPGVPGIGHFGHTGTVAWGITNAMADYQDLYQERLRRTVAGVQAYGPRGWRPARTHRETIEVAGGPPVEIEVVETERGPVIIGGPDDAEAISLRYPPRVRAELGFATLPALLRARRVADVDRAFDRWVEPVNVVLAADVDGGLLHRVAGAVPVRASANGRGVVPGWEPAHAWRGWHHPLPRAEVHGFAVMANERGVAAPLGVEFAPPYRADRIRHLLGAETRWRAERMTSVHLDDLLPAASPLPDLLATIDDLSPAAAALRDRLRNWDRRMSASSADAALFAAVRAAVVRRLAAHPTLAGLSDAPPYPALFLPWLALLPRIAYALDTLLVAGLLPAAERQQALRAALEEVAAAPPQGAWGTHHRLAPWSALGETEETYQPGLAGDHDCVLATSSVPGITHHCARAPAARYVWDLTPGERGRWIVPFGADGAPGSPHYADQLPLWLRGDLIPVVTDWTELTKERDVH